MSSRTSSPRGEQGATQLRLSGAARNDLIQIIEYGAAHFGEEAADDYARGFREAFALLRQHPQAGPVWSELGRGVRYLVHKRHHIFYRICNNGILILRIVHHAQDARTELRKRSG